jgi:hypothetical protein
MGTASATMMTSYGDPDNRDNVVPTVNETLEMLRQQWRLVPWSQPA